MELALGEERVKALEMQRLPPLVQVVEQAATAHATEAGREEGINRRISALGLVASTANHVTCLCHRRGKDTLVPEISPMQWEDSTIISREG